jgi:hypothetical protein
VTENGIRPDREHGRHPPALPEEESVAHGVHPLMHAMQPTALEPVLDGPRPETERQELTPRDDTVLLLGESRDRGVPLLSTWFSPYDGVNDGLTGHCASVAPRV